MNSASHEGQFTAHSQLSITIAPELRYEVGGNQFAFIPYVRFDNRDTERTHLDLREAYWRRNVDRWTFLVGINKVFWGVAESRHLVDIINQDDVLEDIDGEDKLGQPMLNVSLQESWGNLSVYLLPKFRARVYPGVDSRLRPTAVVEGDSSSHESATNQAGTDFAVRYSHYVGDWDIGISYFSGTGREPRFQFDSNDETLVPQYDSINQVGVDLQFTRDAWLWKMESIIREGQGRTFGAMVAGFEYTFYQIRNGNLDVGILFEYLHDDRDPDPTIAPPTLFDNDAFLGVRLALNDTHDSAVLAGAVADVSEGATLLLLEAKRRIFDRWVAEAEIRIVTGAGRDAVLRNIEDDDFVTFRLSYFFQ